MGFFPFEWAVLMVPVQLILFVLRIFNLYRALPVIPTRRTSVHVPSMRSFLEHILVPETS